MNKKISIIKTHDQQEVPTSIRTRKSYNLSQLSNHHSPSQAHVGLKAEFLKPDGTRGGRLLAASPSYGTMYVPQTKKAKGAKKSLISSFGQDLYLP